MSDDRILAELAAFIIVALTLSACSGPSETPFGTSGLPGMPGIHVGCKERVRQAESTLVSNAIAKSDWVGAEWLESWADKKALSCPD
jgi:hypothetical protein